MKHRAGYSSSYPGLDVSYQDRELIDIIDSICMPITYFNTGETAGSLKLDKLRKSISHRQMIQFSEESFVITST